MTEARPAIVLERVDKSYAGSATYVVRDFSLSITRGEFFGLIGPSGCGKSTVIKMIAGIEAPTSGAVTRPERIGMVFQSYALLPWLTVEANVSFAARMAGFAPKRSRPSPGVTSRWSASRISPNATRANSPAANASALGWRAPWPSNRAFC